MAIRINNIVLDIEEDKNILKTKALKKLSLKENHILNFKIVKESIDARRKNSIKFNYSVEIECENENRIVAKLNDKDIKLNDKPYELEFKFGKKKPKNRPIIIGMGPAGMFAGLLMAEKGYKPLIFERGEKVEDRTISVEEFWKSGKLNLESNVQFGEGGAGTFSDGKLTTRIKDVRCDYILEKLVENGAPEEIVYSGKPHIGTDILKKVVKNIREKIIALGGEIKFNSKLEKVKIKDKKLSSIIVNGEEIESESLILAIGHSSRDTYEMLYKSGVMMEAKPFAIGVRVEHLQRLIDENQYGAYYNHPRLKAADYRLTHTCKSNNRPVYSFCMCPGGVVVAASSEEGRLVTNGMSYYKRDEKNANSAIVVGVGPYDFEGKGPLSGMEFQRHYEKMAYDLCKGYKAPIQKIGDFLEDKVSEKIGNVNPTYRPGYEFKDLRKCLPDYVVESLKEGFLEFDRKIKGFSSRDAIMTGIETRTSAPLRLIRNENLQSINVEGLYPSGEGAGYAGGIVSAAVDGIKCAEKIMGEFLSYY